MTENQATRHYRLVHAIYIGFRVIITKQSVYILCEIAKIVRALLLARRRAFIWICKRSSDVTIMIMVSRILPIPIVFNLYQTICKHGKCFLLLKWLTSNKLFVSENNHIVSHQDDLKGTRKTFLRQQNSWRKGKSCEKKGNEKYFEILKITLTIR